MLMMQQHLDRAAIHNPIKNRNETVNSPLKRDNIEHEHPPLLVKNYFLQYIAPWPLSGSRESAFRCHDSCHEERKTGIRRY